MKDINEGVTTLNKKSLSVFILVSICFIFCISPVPACGEAVAAGNISFMIGDVFVSSDGNEFNEADFNMTVMEGDYVKTDGDSRCEITLKGGTILRMDENSLQQIESVPSKTDSQATSVFVSAGKVWFNARKILSKGESFKVRTNKAVCAIRGTTFSVDESQDATRVRVHEGKVATWSSLFEKREDDNTPASVITKPQPVRGPYPVSMEEWVEIVNALQQITIDDKGGYKKQNFDIEKVSEDPWVAWNINRDKLVQK